VFRCKGGWGLPGSVHGEILQGHADSARVDIGWSSGARVRENDRKRALETARDVMQTQLMQIGWTQLRG